jgi:ribonuclease P/MRP protein subunit RPP40
MNIKYLVDVVYFDFQKAFDTISHLRLVIKLESYGFSGHLLPWIKAFLSNGMQTVEILDLISDKFEVINEMPQGSVLGPAFF